MENSMIFSYTQLLMLALSQGFDGIAGLPGFTPENDAEVILSEVNLLANSGMINPDGSRFVCSPIAAEIGRRLGESKEYVAIHTKNRNVPDISCFPGEKLMLCTALRTSSRLVSVRFLSVSDLIILLNEEKYLPDYGNQARPDEKTLELFEKDHLIMLNPNVPLDEYGDVLFSAELVGTDGQSRGFIRVISYYLYKYILFSLRGEVQRKEYCSTEVDEVLKGLISGYDFG